MPAPSERFSIPVVGGCPSASNAGLQTRGCGGGRPDDKASAADEARKGFEAPPVSSDTPNGPSMSVAQHGQEANQMPTVTERPRRQKRRSLKLMVPSLQLGRRRNLSLPPIIASVASLDYKRIATSPSLKPSENVSSSPNSPRRFWHFLRSSQKGSELEVNIQTSVSNTVSEDTYPILDDEDDKEIHVKYCDSPLSDYHSMVFDPIEELESQPRFIVPGEPQAKDSTPCILVEPMTTRPSIENNLKEHEDSSVTEQLTTQDPLPIDPAYKALLPIVYGLEEITTNPRRRSVGEEHEDEDYSKFWETFGQLSAKEVLYAVYAIRAGTLDAPVRESPIQHWNAPLLTTLCATWAGLATILAVYFYFCP